MRDRFENLSRLLESRSPIDIDETPHAVWLIEFRDPSSPLRAQSVDVLVGARSQSRSCTGELHLARDRYTDEEIVELAIDLMKRIVSGELVIRKNSVPREISANVTDRSESDPAGATESVVGARRYRVPLET